MRVIFRSRRNLVKVEGDSCCCISCVGTVKHECPRSIAFCIPEVARRTVLDVSCVATIKRINTG